LKTKTNLLIFPPKEKIKHFSPISRNNTKISRLAQWHIRCGFVRNLIKLKNFSLSATEFLGISHCLKVKNFSYTY